MKPVAIGYDPKNWLRLLLDVPRSRVFRTLALDVAACGLYSALVVYLESNVTGVILSLGPALLSILGIILGLLLVFRTNTAYDRWWEGRRLWGQLVNVSRGVAHQLDAMLADDGARAELRQRYASLLAAFPASLVQQLRAPGSVQGDMAPSALLSAIHRGLHRDILHGHLVSDARIILAPLLQTYDDAMGGCERIRNTPIPVSYSSFVKQFVLVYAVVMPFGLFTEFGYGAVVASMLTFFATMGLELLAEEIEDPFGDDRNDLPLEALTATIVRDVHAILGVAAPAANATDA